MKTLSLKLDETGASLEHSLEMACTSFTGQGGFKIIIATNAKIYKIQTT